ncbi:MAG: methyltransferase family protein [Longimicrobiales bacterium]
MLTTLVRALTYASLFVGFVLVFLPARVLEWSGIARPAIGAPQIIGGAILVLGGSLALWCVVTFALAGRGTPAPFDPPRRLVTSGPYAHVRNPMYLGAALALAGAALFYGSVALLGYMLVFLIAAHVFVVNYEEPTLRRAFGDEYRAYCRRVRRWWPRLAGGDDNGTER